MEMSAVEILSREMCSGTASSSSTTFESKRVAITLLAHLDRIASTLRGAAADGGDNDGFADLDFAIDGEHGSTFRLLLALLQTCYMVNDANSVRF